jgi:hypothetical protein
LLAQTSSKIAQHLASFSSLLAPSLWTDNSRTCSKTC